MLKNIDNAIRKYILKVEALKTAYNEEKEKIDKTYVKNSEFWNDLTTQLEEKHETTLAGLKENTQKTIEDTYKAIYEKISVFISEPIPSGFSDTYKALESNLDTFTLEELQAVADRYKDNYLATRSITELIRRKLEAMGQTAPLPIELIELDVLKGELDSYKKNVCGIVDSYKGDRTYSTDCFMMGDNNPSDKVNTMLNEFLSVND